MSQAGRFTTASSIGAVQTLTGNSGGAVGPDGSQNINVVGDGTTITIAGNPGTHTLTASVIGGFVTTFDADSGSATPAAGIITMHGGNNITTSAAGSTVTYNVSGTTNHALQLGNALGSLTSLGVATNGQIPIGSTGADPVLNTITAGSGVTVTNGAGTITIAATGSGGTVTSITAGTGITLTPNPITTTGSVALTVPVVVSSGGTGATSMTAHSLILGQGTSAFTALGAATNGQIPIGSTGADPVLATITAGTGITVTNGAGSITIASSGTMTLTYTNVNTTPYVVLTTDEYLSVDCSGGAITVQLPNAATLGKVFIVKDRTGSAGASNITVTTVGGAVNIDGATTFVMNANYQSAEFIGNGTSYEVF